MKARLGSLAVVFTAAAFLGFLGPSGQPVAAQVPGVSRPIVDETVTPGSSPK